MTNITDFVPLDQARPRSDGRIYIRCKNCGETFAVYRFFPGDVHIAKTLANEGAQALVEWLGVHGQHIYNIEDDDPNGLPSLEFVVS